MDKQLKGRIGHRGQAFTQLAQQLQELLGAESASQGG
jgi:inosine/xanthosine triphosphate pyrophosphatase family protein